MEEQFPPLVHSPNTRVFTWQEPKYTKPHSLPPGVCISRKLGSGQSWCWNLDILHGRQEEATLPPHSQSLEREDGYWRDQQKHHVAVVWIRTYYLTPRFLFLSLKSI